ncbi:hypothetical protein I7646_23745 [Shigella flexneri]|nr:hypothetical protein [Shigella flexneri]
MVQWSVCPCGDVSKISHCANHNSPEDAEDHQVKLSAQKLEELPARING